MAQGAQAFLVLGAEDLHRIALLGHGAQVGQLAVDLGYAGLFRQLLVGGGDDGYQRRARFRLYLSVID